MTFPVGVMGLWILLSHSHEAHIRTPAYTGRGRKYTYIRRYLFILYLYLCMYNIIYILTHPTVEVFFSVLAPSTANSDCFEVMTCIVAVPICRAAP